MRSGYLLPPRSGFFCPGNLLFSNRLIKLFLLRDFETRLVLGLPSIFGVWPLTLPALVKDPCVGIYLAHQGCGAVFYICISMIFLINNISILKKSPLLHYQQTDEQIANMFLSTLFT
jgi:hypothetical protein